MCTHASNEPTGGRHLKLHDRLSPRRNSVFRIVRRIASSREDVDRIHAPSFLSAFTLFTRSCPIADNETRETATPLRAELAVLAGALACRFFIRS